MGSTNKQYKVIVSERASDMLVQHTRFMAKVSQQAAEKFRAELVEAAKSLQSFPERNSVLSDLVLPVNKYRKMVVSSQYLLIYQIKGDMVHIEYIVDCRQDYQWLL